MTESPGSPGEPPPPGSGWPAPPPPPPPPAGSGWPPPPPPGYGYGYGQAAPGYPPYPPYPPYQYGPTRETEGLAIAALILAIASFVICPVIPSIVALILAASARRNIDESGGMKDGLGLVTAARIIAWVNLGLAAVVITIIVIVAIVNAGSSTTSTALVHAARFA